MAVKSRNVYVCEQCGYESVKWYGKCPGCGQWNTMNEELRTTDSQQKTSAPRPPLSKSQSISEINTHDEHRYRTDIHELDRVLGGGVV